MIRDYLNNQDGAVSVSASWLLTIMFVLVGGGVEMAHSYWQSNAIQHAAKMGARIATTSAPVAVELTTMTGLQGGVDAGDPMPDYKIVCSGGSQSCNRGGFNQDAFDAIFYGRDRDGQCDATNRERRGMCDLFDQLDPEDVTVTYQNSGMGRAGSPPALLPLVTVTVSGVEQDYVFLDFLGTRNLSTQVTVLGEDLR